MCVDSFSQKSNTAFPKFPYEYNTEYSRKWSKRTRALGQHGPQHQGVGGCQLQLPVGGGGGAGGPEGDG